MMFPSGRTSIHTECFHFGGATTVIKNGATMTFDADSDDVSARELGGLFLVCISSRCGLVS